MSRVANGLDIVVLTFRGEVSFRLCFVRPVHSQGAKPDKMLLYLICKTKGGNNSHIRGNYNTARCVVVGVWYSYLDQYQEADHQQKLSWSSSQFALPASGGPLDHC